MEDCTRIIVAGASAGGFPAIAQVIGGLSGRANAAIFIVPHISRKSNGHSIIVLRPLITAATNLCPSTVDSK